MMEEITVQSIRGYMAGRGMTLPSRAYSVAVREDIGACDVWHHTSSNYGSQLDTTKRLNDSEMRSRHLSRNAYDVVWVTVVTDVSGTVHPLEDYRR